MKFNEYLKNQKCKIGDEEKLLIFDDIKTQITKQSIFSRASFYIKVGVYSIILVFLFSGLFLNFKTNISNNVKIEVTKSDIVMADYIGKIIKYKGDFEIYDNKQKLNTKFIKVGNTIILKNNAYIKVSLNNSIKAYLLGPAKVKFDFDKGQNIYTLNLIDGNYITVKSNSDDDKIILKSEFFNIKSNDKDINIEYKKEKGASVVNNNGGDIVIKNKNKTIKLANKERLIVLDNNDKEYIESLFSSRYKKYQISKNGELKIIPSASDLKTLGLVIDKETIKSVIGDYILGKIDNYNGNIGEKQILAIIVSMYKVLGEKIDLNNLNDLNNNKLIDLLSKLNDQINKKYILPDTYTQRIKVILAYLVIIDKVKIEYGIKFNSLEQFVNYLKIDNKYKNILLNF